MKCIRGRRSFLTQMFLAALPLLLVSCSSWQRTLALSEPSARDTHYSQLRVELAGGGVRVLRDPWFSGDTLYGRSDARVMVPRAPSQILTVKYEKGDTVAIPIA